MWADVSDGVEVLAVVQDRIVAVAVWEADARWAYSPELDEDVAGASGVLRMCEGK